MNLLRLVMIGPVGSGKGTIAGYIMKEFENFVHISPGDILRREVQNNTKLGNKAKNYMAKGLLVPDEIILGSIFNALDNASTQNWILDGFPRTIEQAEMLHDTSCESAELNQNPISGVLHVIVPENILLKRTSSRWIHLPSGRVYSAGFREPRVKWKDDETGENLVQRTDDSDESVVMKRLKLYREETEPLIDFYQDYGVEMLEVHNYGSEDVRPNVKKFLKELSEE